MKPTKREIELYYFTTHEVRSILGYPGTSTIRGYLCKKKIKAVKHNNAWMIPPDQIPALRKLIRHSTLKTSSLKTNGP